MIKKLLLILTSAFLLTTAVTMAKPQPDTISFDTDQLIDDINHAQYSIVLTSYQAEPVDELEKNSNTGVIKAMLDAEKRGVKVTMIFNGFLKTNKLYSYWHNKTQSIERQWCHSNSIICSFPSADEGVYHDKIAVIDDHITYIFTGNFPWDYCHSLQPTTQTKHCRVNLIARFTDKTTANYLKNLIIFDASKTHDIGEWDAGNEPKFLLISPLNHKKYINFIANSKQSLLVFQPFLMDHLPFSIEDALRNALNRGVQINIITNKSSNQGLNQQFIKMLQDYPKQLSIRYAPSLFFIHAKIMIRDQKEMVLGSINWTYWSLYKNREVSIIHTNPENIDFVTQAFNTLWQQSEPVS